jgi:hypothetical protein
MPGDGGSTFRRQELVNRPVLTMQVRLTPAQFHFLLELGQGDAPAGFARLLAHFGPIGQGAEGRPGRVAPA